MRSTRQGTKKKHPPLPLSPVQPGPAPASVAHVRPVLPALVGVHTCVSGGHTSSMFSCDFEVFMEWEDERYVGVKSEGINRGCLVEVPTCTRYSTKARNGETWYLVKSLERLASIGNRKVSLFSRSRAHFVGSVCGCHRSTFDRCERAKFPASPVSGSLREKVRRVLSCKKCAYNQMHSACFFTEMLGRFTPFRRGSGRPSGRLRCCS